VSAYTGKVALVTGGASGIGRALCQQLASAGATVVLSDVDEAGASALTAELKAAGHTAESSAVDVTDADAVKAWVEGAAKTHGRIDYLFNNAGIAIIGDTHEQTVADWEPVIRVNFHGVVHGVMAAYPLMVTQGHGHLVNISSISGLVPAPHFTVYSATKHAVVGLSSSLRAEARAFGVKVSAVCPGFIETPIIENAVMTNFDRAKATAEVLPLANSVDACARAILRGVRRNKPVIVVTGHGKLLAFLQRFAPWTVRMIARHSAKRLRAICHTRTTDSA
jgi:NAD(P)-dependent dehydrogenase (short-subunit alcohol dehydrogenase family)